MNNTAKNRAKWAYIREEEIQERIDCGQLDAYDIIYAKDTRNIIMLNGDAEPQHMGSFPVKCGNGMNLTDLEDGSYKIIGAFKTPDGVSVNSPLGNLVIKETIDGSVYITRIAANDATIYSINSEGNVKTNKYLNTDDYINIEESIAAVNTKLDSKVIELAEGISALDQKVDKGLEAATMEEIDALFNTN